MSSKGKKREASPTLESSKVQDSKKLNLQHDLMEEQEESAPANVLGTTNQEPPVGQHGSHDQVAEEDHEISKIKSDLKKLKNITMKQREEIRDGISAITNKLGEMFIAHAATATSANFYGDFIEEINARLMDSELRERARDKKIDGIVFTNQKAAARMNCIERDVNENTQERKSGNLVLNGVPEKENEDCLSTASTYLTHIDPKFDKNQITNAYRLGRKGGSTNKYRTLLVKFKDVAVKEEIVKKKAILKNKKELSKFHCNEDLPPTVRKVRQEMREIAKYALKIGYKHAKAVGNKLQIEDKVFYEDELYLLPADLHMSNIKTQPVGGGIGFQSEHSYMSNFYPCPIKMHLSTFSSAEQAFFYHKAIICEKEEAGMRLKELDDPKTIKAKGDKIPTCEAWEKSKTAVMKKILLQKFIQNPELKAKLLGTTGTRLLECTNNRFWGTGWFLDEPQWEETNIYPGKNVLGKLLEEVRESLDDNVLNSTDAIVGLEPMDTGTGGESMAKRQRGVDLSMPDVSAIQEGNTRAPVAPVLSKGVVAYSCVKQTSSRKPSAKEMSKEIRPTVLESNTSETVNPTHSTSQDDTKRSSADSSRESGSTLVGEVAEPDNYDAISFSSSIFSDGNDSFNAKNVTLPNGKLDVDKLMSWSLPVVNLSRVLERSSKRSPGTRNKIARLMEAQKNKTNPSTSTPAAGNISTIWPKSKRKDNSYSVDYSEPAERLSEKESIRKMLENTNT